MKRGSITIHEDSSWSLLIHGEADEDIVESVWELIKTNHAMLDWEIAQQECGQCNREDDA